MMEAGVGNRVSVSVFGGWARQCVVFFCALSVVLVSFAAAQPVTRPITNLAEANQVLEQAHLAYERGDAADAMQLYARIAHAGYGTARIWANAGTAAYRSGDVGRAVLYYRRALAQDPDYRPARESLSVVSPATNEGSGTNAIEQLVARVSPGLWIIGAQVALLIVCFALARAMSSADRELRGHWVAVLGWCLALTVVLGGLGFYSHHIRTGGNEAVIIGAGAVSRSEPREQAVAKLELPPGTIVLIKGDPMNGFVPVETRSGEAGFIAADALERI